MLIDGGHKAQAFLWPGRTDLLTLLYKHHTVIFCIRVHELTEALQLSGVVQACLSLTGIGVDDMRHLGLQFGANTQAVLYHNLAQVVDTTLEIIHPGGGAL